MAMTIEVQGFADGSTIPGQYAFCVPATEGHVTLAPNRNPHVVWGNAPQDTRSFALLCIDADAPTDPTNVNREGVTVPSDLPRADFSHWVLIDIPATVREIPEAAASDGVTPKGKPVGPTPHGLAGRNDYTSWFAGDADMAGTYGGYDGPCPPWNDELVHHYRFSIYALDVDSLGLSGPFGAADVATALEGHVLDSAAYLGTFSLNPDVQ
jgi:Raf kinase inhibitor-like YbhB/YbcL family protein